jgi:hypothetical protein
VLRCDGCGCSSFFAKGWQAFLVDGEGEGEARSFVLCPPCAAGEHEDEHDTGYR